MFNRGLHGAHYHLRELIYTEIATILESKRYLTFSLARASLLPQWKEDGLGDQLYNPWLTGMQLPEMILRTLEEYFVNCAQSPSSKAKGLDTSCSKVPLSRLLFLAEQWCNVSCDNILQSDWTTLYSAEGQGSHSWFTRPILHIAIPGCNLLWSAKVQVTACDRLSYFYGEQLKSVRSLFSFLLFMITWQFSIPTWSIHVILKTYSWETRRLHLLSIFWQSHDHWWL